MTIWVNRVVFAGPRNGTNSHTIDPSSATDSVAGTPFTPTAGRFLVATAYGGVTSTTPTGWTLDANAAAINNGGLYMWYRTAAGGDTFTTTHNGSNFGVFFEVLEFAAGSSFVGAEKAVNVGLTGDSSPTLVTAAGTKLFIGLAGLNNSSSGNAISFTWTPGTELTDQDLGAGATDRVGYSSAYIEDSTATSQAMTANNTGGAGGTSLEKLMVAISAAAPDPDPVIMMRPLIVVP